MLFPCLNQTASPDPLPSCTPQCVRWSQINAGQPVRVFHDITGWDPNYYPGIDNPDPDIYFQQAIQTWNMAYARGDLYVQVFDRAEADTIFQYRAEDPNDPCSVVGQALCTCDDDDDVCIRNIDHSQVFATSPAQIWMIYVDCLRGRFTANQWVNVMIHELGHNLGMGHVYGLPIESVMGNANDQQLVTLYDHDIEQLDLRHPSNCVLTASRDVITSVDQFYNSTCPGCQAKTWMLS